MNPPGKILIIRLSSLGDILHALPAVQSLRTTYPKARIDWLVERRMAFLLSAVPGIDGIITIDTAALRTNPLAWEAWRQAAQAIRRLRSARYDISLDFQGLIKTAGLSLLSGADARIGFSRELVREKPAHWFYQRRVSKPAKPAHIVALNQLLAAEAGAIPRSERVNLSVPSEDEAAIDSLLSEKQLGEFVVINPGGGWYTKRWSPARYGALAARIGRELGLSIGVTTGPGEEMLFEKISSHCEGAKLHNFQVPFLQLVPLIRRARLLIGGDTGPFHLACALGIPVVGIFGPTDPARNGPWGGMDECLVRVLPCSFCYGRTCPTQNECMDIGVEQVFQAVVRRLARTD
jgi:lipopolysaccharide heptosyltransferase I